MKTLSKIIEERKKEFEENFILHASDCSAKEGGICDCGIDDKTIEEINDFHSQSQIQILEHIVKELPNEIYAYFDERKGELNKKHPYFLGEKFGFYTSCGLIRDYFQSATKALSELKKIKK